MLEQNTALTESVQTLLRKHSRGAVASCGLGRALKRDVIAEALKPALLV